jgi:hypothetical protein
MRNILNPREFLEDMADMPTADSRLLYQWMITEDIQDHNPYVEWGWDGFMPGILFRW